MLYCSSFLFTNCIAVVFNINCSLVLEVHNLLCKMLNDDKSYSSNSYPNTVHPPPTSSQNWHPRKRKSTSQISKHAKSKILKKRISGCDSDRAYSDDFAENIDASHFTALAIPLSTSNHLTDDSTRTADVKPVLSIASRSFSEGDNIETLTEVPDVKIEHVESDTEDQFFDDGQLEEFNSNGQSVNSLSRNQTIIRLMENVYENLRTQNKFLFLTAFTSLDEFFRNWEDEDHIDIFLEK